MKTITIAVLVVMALTRTVSAFDVHLITRPATTANSCTLFEDGSFVCTAGRHGVSGCLLFAPCELEERSTTK